MRMIQIRAFFYVAWTAHTAVISRALRLANTFHSSRPDHQIPQSAFGTSSLPVLKVTAPDTALASPQWSLLIRFLACLLRIALVRLAAGVVRPHTYASVGDLVVERGVLSCKFSYPLPPNPQQDQSVCGAFDPWRTATNAFSSSRTSPRARPAQPRRFSKWRSSLNGCRRRGKILD